MNKLWIALIVGVLLLLILTITLSVVLTKKKKKKDVEVPEVIWAFHCEHDSNLKLRAELEEIMNVDILKKSDYSAGGNNANVREVSHDFTIGKLTGWTHYYEHPLKVKKVVVGSNEIVVQKIVALAGFTFFNMAGSPDFVTLWHDNKFHHYSTAGELLAIGAFPFAEGDLSIHPDKLKLPKEFTGKDFEQTTSAEESDLEFPKDQILPPAESKAKAESLTIDLNRLKTVNDDEDHTYTEGSDEITLRKTVYNDTYRKVTYALKNNRAFSPLVKIDQPVDLGCNAVSDFVVYLNSTCDEPLLITLREPKSVKTFVHTGGNAWVLVSIPSVTVEVLDDVHCYLNDFVVLDFSHQSASYKSGKHTIEVTATNASDEPYATFKSFKHNIYKLDAEGNKTNATAKVYKFKYLRSNFTGLAHDRLVNFATVFFWQGDLTKPLLIRLTPSAGSSLDYYGYKEYVTEKMPTMLGERLQRLNFEVNRVFVANLNRQDGYDFKGGVSGTGQKDVIVKVTENTPLEGFKKCVHTHKDGGDKSFHITRFLSEDNLTVSLPDVLTLETYFFPKISTSKPFFFALKGTTLHHYYVLENGSYVKKDLVNRNMVLTIKHLLYNADKYLTVDLMKFATYNFSGEAASANLPKPNVLVKRFNLTGFVRIAHTLEINDSAVNFRLLGLKGARLEYDNNEFSGVEAYFCNGHLEVPLAIILKGTTPTNDLVYVAQKSGFEKKDHNYLTDDLLTKLMKLAQTKLDLVYLNLDKEDNYNSASVDTVKVEVTSEDFETDGKKKNTHKFRATEDVRLTYGEKYFKPQVEFSGKLVKVVAIVDSTKAPLMVTFVDTNDKEYHFRKDQNAWKRVKSADLNAQEGTEGSTETKSAAETPKGSTVQAQQAQQAN